MFQVGQHVLCVRAFSATLFNPGENGPKEGTVYTVRAVERDGGDVGLRLHEIVNPHVRCTRSDVPGWFFEERVFHAEHFRPLSSDRLSIFRQHFAPSPTDKVDA